MKNRYELTREFDLSSATFNTEKSVLCMNPDDTKEYLWGTRVTLYKLLVAIIGTPLLSYANAVSIIMTAQARQEVIATDYYSKVLTISWGAGAEKGSYVYGWDTHPICYIYDSTQSPDVY